MQGRDDWDERELDEGEALPERAPERGPRWWVPWVLWSLLPLGLFALWIGLRGRGREATEPAREAAAAMEPADPGEPPSGAGPGESEPPLVLPPLSESDPLLREMASPLSRHPYLASILQADDLARKLVVSLANVAEGTSPVRQLSYLRPDEKFSAIASAERVVIDPASYRRYDAACEAFDSLEPRAVARLYRLLRPLLEEAHAELGLSDREGIDDTLARAVAVLLDAPVVEGPVLLRPISVSYAFDDPDLEGLAPAQKHLLRMGPENVRRVQKKLSEIAAAIDLTLPPRRQLP